MWSAVAAVLLAAGLPGIASAKAGSLAAAGGDDRAELLLVPPGLPGPPAPEPLRGRRRLADAPGDEPFAPNAIEGNETFSDNATDGGGDDESVSESTTEAPTQDPAAGEGPQTTTLAVETTRDVALSEQGGDEGSGTTLVIVLALLGSVCFLCLLIGCLGIFLHRRKVEVERQHADVEFLEQSEGDYEAKKACAKSSVEAYAQKFDLQPPQTTGPLLEGHQNFMAKWRVFLNESRRFLEEDYTPALRAREQASNPRLSAASASASSGPAGYAVRQASSASRLKAHSHQGWLPRARPVTPAGEVQRQLRKLESLEKKLDGMLLEFQGLESKAFPGAGASAGFDAPPPPNNSGSSYSSFYNPGRADALEAEVEILKGFVHPLIARVAVKDYGVLGRAQHEKEPKPGEPIAAVVVDPAGWHFIGRGNSMRGAAGAAQSIYTWLGRGPEARFPEEVHSHFDTFNEAEAETRAKFHKYGPGQLVIHAVGPKVGAVQEGVSDLSTTYANILSEYCRAAAAANAQLPPVLRLLPVSSGIFLRNKRLDRHMPELTAAALSLAFAVLTPSLREQLAGVSIELCIFEKKAQQAYRQAFEARAAGLSSPMRLPQDCGCVARHNYSFDWVRQKNAPQDRLERLCAMLASQRAIAVGGYVLPMPDGDRLVKLESEAMLKGTRTLVSPAALSAKADSSCGQTQVVREERLTVMEAAAQEAARNARVVAVNAASAYHVGGGVLTGGRHALEETWCTISTLLGSLQKSAAHAPSAPADFADGFGPRHVPADGCIVSPEVVIFRETSAKGYAFQAQATKLAGVCSVAMFNMNPRVRDSPVDAPRDFNTYCSLIKAKFRAVVAGAVELKADVLVCPDVGCGVFENDPHIVGTMLGEVLQELPGVVARVVLTGKARFASAVQAAMAEPQRAQQQRQQLWAPPYFDLAAAVAAGPPSAAAAVLQEAVVIGAAQAPQAAATGPGKPDRAAAAKAAAPGYPGRRVESSKVVPARGQSVWECCCCGAAAQVDSPAPPTIGGAAQPRAIGRPVPHPAPGHSSGGSPPTAQARPGSDTSAAPAAAARPQPKLSADGDAAGRPVATRQAPSSAA
mmetsp:Transcript_48631/g.141735  ORF Transcript_48631/g.141735 Transcript_48631/m.141735 type:complete len:1088 (-) Transcript_48631:131-3394(-)